MAPLSSPKQRIPTHLSLLAQPPRIGQSFSRILYQEASSFRWLQVVLDCHSSPIYMDAGLPACIALGYVSSLHSKPQALHITPLFILVNKRHSNIVADHSRLIATHNSWGSLTIQDNCFSLGMKHPFQDQMWKTCSSAGGSRSLGSFLVCSFLLPTSCSLWSEQYLYTFPLPCYSTRAQNQQNLGLWIEVPGALSNNKNSFLEVVSLYIWLWPS